MSTTAVRTPSLSSSYVPRNGSRPASPSLPPSYVPRSERADASRVGSPAQASTMAKERSKSSLRNEIKQDKKEVDVTAVKAAEAIIKMLSSLPAPLPGTLPPRVLKTPKPTPTEANFVEYASAKRKSPSSGTVGLGLDLDGHKRHKQSASPELNRLKAFSAGSPGGSKALQRGSQADSPAGESKERWTRDRWHEAFNYYHARAVLAKRHGDALCRSSSARPEFTAKLPHDPVKGLLYHTDSVLLFLYSFWCEEQYMGRARTTSFQSSDALRNDTRQAWERAWRQEEQSPESKEMKKCMVGLMYLLEAMALNQQFRTHENHLHRRWREVSAASSIASATPTSSAHAPHTATIPTTVGGHGPSPSSNASSDHLGPSPSSASSDTLPADMIPLIGSAVTTSTRSATYMQTSRFYLSMPLLQARFGRTYENIMASDFSDEALPAPGDVLGSGKTIDPDVTHRFAWPIELGMCAGLAHLVAFGRGMVEEYAEQSGYTWEKKLE